MWPPGVAIEKKALNEQLELLVQMGGNVHLQLVQVWRPADMKSQNYFKKIKSNHQNNPKRLLGLRKTVGVTAGVIRLAEHISEGSAPSQDECV